MPARSKPEIIRSMFAAYRSKDRATVEALLTDDFTFTSPYDDAIGKAVYFERCWPNSQIEVYFGATYHNGAFVKAQ